MRLLSIQAHTDLSPEEKQKQQDQLRQQFALENKGILSPEELEEFRLRLSPFGSRRGSLLAFAASEEEFRTMARLTLNEKPVPTDQSARDYETKLAEQQAEKEKVDEQMKVLLGKKRFAEYEQAKDPDFQNLNRLGRRYDLSLQTVSEAHELAQAIKKQVQAVEKANLPGEEREATLETIRQQARQKMIAILGARAAETYRRNFNNWDEIPDSK